MSVTIKDLARAAGVSVATISRALNRKGPVSDAVRDRIRALAAEMHYVPHGAARSLVTSKTNTVGVLLPDIHGAFYSELIRGIDLAARSHGYHLLVSGSHSDREEVAAVLEATRGRVDGLIVMSPDVDSETLQATLPPTLPIVLLNSSTRDERYDDLRVDNYGGAFTMVRHLLDLDQRCIAHVAGPANNHDAQERLRGFREAMQALGGGSTQALEVASDFTEEGGYRAGQELLAATPRPTAVFAANDAMAIGVLCACREAGVRVPADVGLVGFDDIPMARFLDPPLTSVHVPITSVGARALERVLLAIDLKNNHERVREVLPATLVVRASCGAVLKRSGALPRQTDTRRDREGSTREKRRTR